MVTQARNVSDCLKPGHGAVRSAAAPFLPRNIWPKASKATAVLKLPGNQQDLTESLISWQKNAARENWRKLLKTKLGTMVHRSQAKRSVGCNGKIIDAIVHIISKPSVINQNQTE